MENIFKATNNLGKCFEYLRKECRDVGGA